MSRIPFQPFPYQLEMTEWLRDKPRAALFAGAGLGKTVSTLKAYSDLILDGECKGLLVVAPLRVCDITWVNEGRKWDFADHLTVANMRTNEGVRKWHEGSADIYLINFEQLPSKDISRTCKVCKAHRVKRRRCKTCKGEGVVTTHYPGFVEKFLQGEKPEGLPVDAVLIDEISLAKNRASKRIEALRAQRHLFTRFHGLTGTPVPNTYLDLWAQIRFLDNGERLGTVYTHFRNKFFKQTDYMGYKWDLKKGAKEKIQDRLRDLTLVMRSEDYLDVPECDYADIELTLPAKAKKQYEELKKELLLQLERGEIEALNAAVLTSKLLQLTGGAAYDGDGEVHELHDAKVKALGKLAKQHKGEPLLVLTAFKHESARILEAFPEAQMFDEKNLDKWQAGEIPIWVADPRSLSHGIDGLQHGGRIAVWFTLTYSSETYIQTNARLVRTGQSEETIIYRLVCSGTVDDAVAEALKVKEGEQAGLMNAVKNLQLLDKTKKDLAA